MKIAKNIFILLIIKLMNLTSFKLEELFVIINKKKKILL